MSSTFAVILAAGHGSRMKSSRHKVLHPVGGKAMVDHLIDTLKQVGVEKPYLVVGHGAESVKSHVGDRAFYCLQKEQLGTGHAVLQAETALKEEDGVTLVLYGDTPLLTGETISKMLHYHQESGSAATLLSTIMDDPTGYGRIIRGEDKSVLRIVEQKDGTEEELNVKEINVGTYCFDNKKLFSSLKRIKNDNNQGEYYLTDVIEILRQDGEKIQAYLTLDTEETIGINDRLALAQAETILRKRINENHMKNGVTIQDPDRTYIEPTVTIGPETVVLAGTHLKGDTSIGSGCVIGPNTEIENSQIHDEVEITYSVIKNSFIDTGSTVGPYAYLRPGSQIGKNVKIGDFVEIKNSTIGDHTKVSHLSYIGDADIGKGVNVGCGAITVNYDGVRKHQTIVEDDAFVGCNVNLVAPVTVGKNAFIAAGSTINQDVPEDALAIARERQTNKENFVTRLKGKQKSSQN